jgi:hypothetical protein
MKIREPLPHWNNFTICELKQILEHCVALETLGIAQDEEMMRDIERDLTLREKKSKRLTHSAKILRKSTTQIEQKTPCLLEQTA